MGSLSVGVDVGGTNIAAGVLDAGSIVGRAKMATPKTGGVKALVAATCAAVTSACAAAEVEIERVAGVGVGVPGQVDPGNQNMLTAANLADVEPPVALRKPLAKALGLHVVIDNDVNVAAHGELVHGAGRGTGDALVIAVGTGIGGALVIDGAVRRGPHGLSGELGHLVYEPGGRACGCGGLGHLEAYAGRAGLEREARRRAAAGEDTALIELAGDGPMKSKVWHHALKADDRIATELIDDAVLALGSALGSIASVVDLTTIIVGGGLADRLGSAFTDRLAHASNDVVFGSIDLAVVPFELGDDAALIGAAALGLPAS